MTTTVQLQLKLTEIQSAKAAKNEMDVPDNEELFLELIEEEDEDENTKRND